MAEILVIDDNVSLQRLLCRVLEMHGFQTDSADTGEQALAQTAEHRYALIFCDFNLPDTTGDVLTADIHAGDLNATTPVVCITAKDISNQEMVAMGFTDRIRKPFEVTDVLRLAGAYTKP